jgi:hypothetical protein
MNGKIISVNISSEGELSHFPFEISEGFFNYHKILLLLSPQAIGDCFPLSILYESKENKEKKNKDAVKEMQIASKEM